MTDRSPGKTPGNATLGIRLELLAIMGVLVASSHAAHMMTIPVLPRFVDSLGGTVLAVGMALAVSSASRLIVNIPAGVLSERVGRKPLIVVGAITVGVFATLAGTASNVPIFLVHRFMGGVGSAMVVTVASVAMTDLTNVANRGRVLGLVQGIQMIVGIGSPALGGLLAEFVGVRAPFFASGVAVLVCAVWAMVRLPETKPRVAPDGVTPEHAPTPARPAALGLLRNSSFLLVCLVGFATFFTRAGASHSLIPLFADQMLGMGPAGLGLLFTGAAVLHGVMVYPAGAIADRFGRKLVIVPAGLLVGIAVALVPFSSSTLTFALAFFFLHGAVGWGGQAPAAYVGDLVPSGLRGMSFGLYRTFGDLGAVVAPVVVTALAQAVSFHAGFFFNAALWLAALLLFGRFARETAGRRRAAEAPGA